MLMGIVYRHLLRRLARPYLRSDDILLVVFS